MSEKIFTCNYHLLTMLILFVAYLTACSSPQEIQNIQEFDGERAYQDVFFQVNLGPRIPGSRAHEQIVEWLKSELQELGWGVEDHRATIRGHDITNIIAKQDQRENLPWIILGAHYDSRLYADRDTKIENRTQAVPGANDGASGVSVLLELARIIPKDLKANIWLVFFDAEDNGNIPGWDWILGSKSFVESLDGQPDAVVIIDMVGDSDLNIFIEKNSDQVLAQEIWDIASRLGYDGEFIPVPKYRIIDDHLPFIQAGIPAVDIIDYDYPYWHTVEDTVDKVSSESLKIVGDVLMGWLIEKYR